MYFHRINIFKKSYLQQLDPGNDWFVLAIRATVASIIAALISLTIYPKQSMFLVLSAIFFMMALPDASKKQQLTGIVLSGLLGTLGMYLATVTADHLILLLLITAIYALIAMSLNRITPTYGMSGILSLILVIVAGGGALSGGVIASQRLYGGLIAIVISLLVAVLIFPKNPLKKLQRYLAILLSDMTDYFYHTSADCLRGNHINPRHWQIKERILLTLNKIHILLAELPDNQAATQLRNFFAAEQQLLQCLLPLTSIMTSPANNAAFINILPALSQFSHTTHHLMCSYRHYLRQPTVITEDVAFVQAVVELQTAINIIIDKTLEKTIIYQWPFDITLFSQLLTAYKQQLLSFKDVLLAMGKP